MITLPKVRECPCCYSINFVKVKGDKYNNGFRVLKNWTLKSEFKCRKCKEEIGFFVANTDYKEKLVWLDDLKCEDIHYDRLKKLKEQRNKLNKHHNKKYYKIINEINLIENKIRADKIKLRIKVKIQKRVNIPNASY